MIPNTIFIYCFNDMTTNILYHFTHGIYLQFFAYSSNHLLDRNWSSNYSTIINVYDYKRNGISMSYFLEKDTRFLFTWIVVTCSHNFFRRFTPLSGGLDNTVYTFFIGRTCVYGSIVTLCTSNM
jgi:hypothetical protein